MTLEQIGGVFGITRERVRQIKEVAFAKLKDAPRLKRLMQEHLGGTTDASRNGDDWGFVTNVNESVQ